MAIDLFFQRGNIKDTQKLRFCISLPTVHPGVMNCLLSDLCVGIPNEWVLLTLTWSEQIMWQVKECCPSEVSIKQAGHCMHIHSWAGCNTGLCHSHNVSWYKTKQNKNLICWSSKFKGKRKCELLMTWFMILELRDKKSQF